MTATIQARPVLRLLTTTIFLCLCALARAAAPTPFADGERVLFLGDSITRSGGWHSQIALFYATRFPDRRVIWLNAGSAATLRRARSGGYSGMCSSGNISQNRKTRTATRADYEEPHRPS